MTVNSPTFRSKQLNEVIIDAMLDVYNDYSSLYEMFKDEEYKKIADGVIALMKVQLNKKKSLSVMVRRIEK